MRFRGDAQAAIHSENEWQSTWAYEMDAENGGEVWKAVAM